MPASMSIALRRAATLRTPARPVARRIPQPVLLPRAAASPKAAMQAAHVQAFKRNVARQRLDYEWLPNGKIRAYLTITLPHGVQFRFTGEGDPRVVAMMIQATHGAQAGSLLGDIWKGAKKIARKVATSKVFKTATKVLSTIGPALGPAAPAAMAASSTMRASTMLLAAKEHGARGNKAAQQKLVLAAAAEAKKGGAPLQQMNVAQSQAERVYALLLRPS